MYAYGTVVVAGLENGICVAVAVVNSIGAEPIRHWFNAVFGALASLLLSTSRRRPSMGRRVDASGASARCGTGAAMCDIGGDGDCVAELRLRPLLGMVYDCDCDCGPGYVDGCNRDGRCSCSHSGGAG